MRNAILTLFLLFSFASVKAQISFNYECYAYTNVDVDYYDFGNPFSDAYDACSSANCSVDQLIEATLQLNQYGCNNYYPDGFPGAIVNYSLYINHNSYPTQNFLTYEVPYAFEYTLEGESFSPDSGTDINYNSGQYFGVEQIGSVSLGTNIGFNFSIDLNNNLNMLLAKTGNGINLYIEAYTTTNQDSDFGLNSKNKLKIIVPSQFYLDNALTSPTSVNVNLNNIGFVTIGVEERCAEDIYLEEGVDVGSYIYSAANNLFADCTVDNNTNIVFSAGNIITLGIGYSVELGSSMSTQLYAGCINP